LQWVLHAVSHREQFYIINLYHYVLSVLECVLECVLESALEFVLKCVCRSVCCSACYMGCLVDSNPSSSDMTHMSYMSHTEDTTHR